MFLRMLFLAVGLHLVAAGAICAPPVPTGSGDVVLGLWYSPDHTHLPQVALDLASSAENSIFVGTSSLSDANFVSTLCGAASGGVAVSAAVLLPSSTSAAGWVQARRLVAAGGTVTRCAAGVTIPSSFVVADQVATLQGPYYFSATAVQAGSYLMLVSGTNSAAVNVAKYGTLISGGTPVVASIDLGAGGDDLVGQVRAVPPRCFTRSPRRPQAAAVEIELDGVKYVPACDAAGRSAQGLRVPGSPPPPPGPVIRGPLGYVAVRSWHPGQLVAGIPWFRVLPAVHRRLSVFRGRVRTLRSMRRPWQSCTHD